MRTSNPSREFLLSHFPSHPFQVRNDQQGQMLTFPISASCSATQSRAQILIKGAERDLIQFFFCRSSAFYSSRNYFWRAQEALLHEIGEPRHEVEVAGKRNRTLSLELSISAKMVRSITDNVNSITNEEQPRRKRLTPSVRNFTSACRRRRFLTSSVSSEASETRSWNRSRVLGRS